MRMFIAGLALLISTNLTLTAAAQHHLGNDFKDVQGSADPPGLKRYDGSTITEFRTRSYDEFDFPLSPVFGKEMGAKAEAATVKHAEGKYVRAVYREPVDRSPLEIMRNYQDNIKSLNGKILWECSAAACDSYPNNTPNGGFLVGSFLINNGHPVASYTIVGPTDVRYFVGMIPGLGAQGATYISVAAFIEGYDDINHGRTMALVDVVQERPMDRNMVIVTAERMDGDIGAQGHVSLYGIMFDFNRADIKPESEPTLAEIAKLLTKEQGLKLLVVGHTDNVGGFDYNVGLSQRRATAVVTVLSSRYHIAASRLRAGGVGMMAPIATNDSDAGRAKNRRVELVKQ